MSNGVSRLPPVWRTQGRGEDVRHPAERPVLSTVLALLDE